MKIALITNAAEAQRQLLGTLTNAQRAVQLGVADATTELKTLLQQEMKDAGLPGLSKTWQATVYPKGKSSFHAAGWVYSKAPDLIHTFTEGAVIRSSKGFFLAIPTKNAPKKGIGGKRISPSNFPVDRYGPLRFVYRPNGPSLLVVDNLRGSYAKGSKDLRGFRKASAKGLAAGNTATVVMFILVRQVTLRKRLSPDTIAQKITEKIPGYILKNLDK